MLLPIRPVGVPESTARTKVVFEERMFESLSELKKGVNFQIEDADLFRKKTIKLQSQGKDLKATRNKRQITHKRSNVD